MTETIKPRVRIPSRTSEFHPNSRVFINGPSNPTERIAYLLGGDRMKGLALGACLDYIWWGGKTSVMYDLGTSGLIHFIKNWQRPNPEPVWNDKPLPPRLQLPFINYKACPVDPAHTRKLRDLGGRVRCAEVNILELPPGKIFSGRYFDKWDGMDAVCYSTEPSNEPGKEPVKIQDACYSVISDKGIVLSLQTVLDRLNIVPNIRTVNCNNNPFSPCKRVDELRDCEKRLYDTARHCPGHEEENPVTVHPFDGWTLAWYVQRWHKQLNGEAPVFNPTERRGQFKKFSNHLFVDGS
ncbi:MAG: hypothetical protein NT076_03095 [Candidatus Pacearchaeota archaeon]|nr:hypothetical protein [Candidatus Pacearchaeota archaeon]